MGELPTLQYGEQTLRPMVLRMTGSALCLRVDLPHPAVYGHRIEHLQSHVHVAGGTTVIHGDPTPGRHMASTTLPANVGMGGNPAKNHTLACIKSARAKHGSTTCEGRDRGQHCHDYCGYDCFSCKKPQMLCLHLPPRQDKL